MASRRDDVVVIWPRYFDAELSRSEGRRVPTDLAVEAPRADDVASALEELGYDADLDADACHPRRPWDARGRVLVPAVEDKETLLREVGEALADGRR